MKLRLPWLKANKPCGAISSASFELIEPIWREHLWKNRISPIEPSSAITPEGKIDMALMSEEPFFWTYRQNDKIIGVMSGFKTSENSFRLRGTWVDENFRNQNIASELLATAIKKARELKCEKVWTMPRSSSWGFYQSNGFKMIGKTSEFEFGPHYFAEKSIANRLWK